MGYLKHSQVLIMAGRYREDGREKWGKIDWNRSASVKGQENHKISISRKEAKEYSGESRRSTTCSGPGFESPLHSSPH